MKYNAIVLAMLDSVTQSFVLNERFHSSHQEKVLFLGSEIICVIERLITKNYIIQIIVAKRSMVPIKIPY